MSKGHFVFEIGVFRALLLFASLFAAGAAVGYVLGAMQGKRGGAERSD